MTAVFLPAVRFKRLSVSERASVLSSICIRRSPPLPYCMVSESPRRLSRTKALKLPASVRNAIPSPPLAFEAATGIAIPTVRYARSARSPSAGWKEPMNRHITAV